MLYQNIISAIGLIGIGAIVQSIISFSLKKREVKSQTQHEFKNVRYKAIILLANALLDFEKHNPELQLQGRNFSGRDDLLEELKVERNNMILFASDQVILALNAYIKNPNEEKFYNLALTMRKDLYGLATKLQPVNLKL